MDDMSRPITRVIGLPGDQISAPEEEIHKIPKGHCWVEGDNGCFSSDSRAYGFVPLGLAQGKPLNRHDFIDIISLLVIKHLLHLLCFHLKGACSCRLCRFGSVPPSSSSSPPLATTTNIKGRRCTIGADRS